MSEQPTDEQDLETYEVGQVVTHVHIEASKVEISVKQTVTYGQRDHWLGATVSHSLNASPDDPNFDEAMEGLISYTSEQATAALVNATEDFLRMRKATDEAAKAARAAARSQA